MMAVAFMFGPFTIDPFLPTFPLVAKTFNVSAALLQFSLTGVTVGMGLGQLLAGPLSDALGRRRPFIAGILLYVIGAAGSAWAPGIESFIGARALMALGASATMVVATAVIRDHASGNAMIAIYSKVFWIQGFAPILSPALASQYLNIGDWRSLFLGFAIFGTAGAVMAFFILAETLERSARRNDVFAGMGHRFAHVLRDRVFVGLVVISLTIQISLFAYLNVFPYIMRDGYGFTQSVLGYLMSAISAAWLLGYQLSAFFAKRVALPALLLWSIALGLVSGIAMVAIAGAKTSGWWLEAAAFTFAVAFGFSAGPTQALALSPHGEEAGTAAALLGVVNFWGTALFSPIYPLLDRNTSIGMGLTTAMCFVIAAAAFLLVVQPGLKRAKG
mgnify:CR=1 FL=1